MKKILSSLLLLLAVCLTSCEYDNYDEPNSILQGKVVYNGQNIYVRNNQVTFRLYEPGWELSASTYMDVQIAQDGTFKASVYGGKTYKLIRQANIGPWVNPTTADTITVSNYNGRDQIAMEVTPYYMLENANITYSNKVVTGTCTVNQITAGRDIEYVGLYAGRNVIIDNSYNFGYSSTASAAAQPADGETITLTVDLSSLSVNSTANSLPSTGFIYARMGLKISGIDAMIYTEPFKLSI
ncbi:DUF3823 domain-containing protein [Phocaeicola sp.]